MHIRIAAIVGALFAATAVQPASATPTLTYDVSPLHGVAGGTVPIGATLALSPGDAPIVTDASGESPGSTFALYRPLDLDSLLFGSSAYFFFRRATWLPPVENPLANLDLQPGESKHLDLGSIWLHSNLPAGTYTTDIGVNANTMEAVTCDCTPFMPPNFADAGLITIDVATAVPEPATIALLGIGVLGVAAVRRQPASRESPRQSSAG